jgi:DNA repair photolyase
MAKYVSNPPNPWDTTTVEWIGEPPSAQLKIYEEDARSALSRNDSDDLNFRWSLNPYRGCFHACAYCYARPTHQYLGFGAGTDFERRIVVKRNIPQRLEEAFEKRAWKGELIALSGNTDCYQPLEASYGLTRACLEVMLRYRNPVGVITKGSLVRRDVDLLSELSRHNAARVYISICFDDARHARLIEPGTPPPAQRFETMRYLADAGIPVGLALAPVIPGLNDSQIPALLERAADAGATSAFLVPLRLATEVRPVFEERLREALPERADKVMNAMGEIRNGDVGESRFGHRMRGVGPRWQAISRLFNVHTQRLGLVRERDASGEPPQTPFRRPRAQMELFA